MDKVEYELIIVFLIIFLLIETIIIWLLTHYRIYKRW